MDLDTGYSVQMHEGEQVLDEQSASMASQAMSKESESCMELCCFAAGSEISQPTNPSILKKTEGCFGSGKNARNRSFLPSWYSFHGFISVALNSKYTATIVKRPMILVQR